MVFESCEMKTQLFDAVERGSIEVLRTLLTRKANVNKKNPDGDGLLHAAVSKKNTEIVKLLIDSKADVNLKNKKGETALHLVFRYDNQYAKAKMMRLLLEAGAKVNTTSKDGKGETTLHAASTTGDVDLVQLLVSRGANVNAKDAVGETPLHYAAQHVFSEEPGMFEALLAAGAGVNTKECDGGTPLHVLSMFKPKIGTTSLCKIVRVFMRYGANLYIRGWNEQTAMDVAILWSNTEAVKALVLVGGMDVNSRFTPSTTRATILHEACDNIDLPTVKFLLKNGANVNALDRNNVSPLKRTINSLTDNDKEDNRAKGALLIRYLFSWNPDVNTITSKGHNILNPYDEENNLPVLMNLPDFITQNSIPDYLWKIVIRHLAKLRAINSSIHPSLLETISVKPEFKDYFDKCRQELELAKISKVHSETWVTFWNLLFDDKKKLRQYAGNMDLAEDLIESKLMEKVPIYSDLIYERFTKAVENREILDQAARTLSDLLPINIDPDHGAIKKILSFLSSKDLRKLCQ